MNDRQLYLFIAQSKTSVDTWALAFVLTEMRFRRIAFRACEFVYAASSIYLLRRDPKITFGKCQVSFEYWRQHFRSRTFSLLLHMEDDRINYAICCRYLDNNRKPSLKETLIQYNGYPSSTYVKTFHKQLARIQLLMTHIEKLSRNRMHSVNALPSVHPS